MKWNRNIYLQDVFRRPKGIDKTNSLSFIIYDSKSTNYMTLVISIDGSVKLYCEKLMRLEKFTNNIMMKFMKKANKLIDKLNTKIITIPKVIDVSTRLDISFIYEIPDYHVSTLSKLFKSFSLLMPELLHRGHLLFPVGDLNHVIIQFV